MRKPKPAHVERPENRPWNYREQKRQREEKRRGGQEKGRELYLISSKLLQTLMIQFQSLSDWNHLRNSEPKPLIHMLPQVLTHRNCKK